MATEAKSPKKKRAFRGRKSKVDAVAHRVGAEPDSVLAAEIGVTTENVRTWRKRRGIEASWAAEDAPKPAKKPAGRKKKGKAKRRKSRLDPFRKELGTAPDRVIAERAGVTPENVRAYRKRHGIPSTWRAAEADVSAPALVAKTPNPTKTPKPRPAPKRATGRAVPPRGWAFRVTADVDGAEREYVTFGADVVEAAQTARDKLARGDSGARIRKIEVVGVAL